MSIHIRAFAEDAILTGDLSLSADRLTDFLELETSFDVLNVKLQALEDARHVDVGTAAILRNEILAVETSGPRGATDRRLRTRVHPMQAQCGPYYIVGYVHALPTAGPFAGAHRRQILPMTSTVVRYIMAGQLVEEVSEGLLLNRDRIDWLKPATGADLQLSDGIELAASLDPLAKDRTWAY